jgi:hypothetical protein
VLLGLDRIYSDEELKEKSMKVLKLNGFITPDYDPAFDPMFRAASSIKPTSKNK